MVPDTLLLDKRTQSLVENYVPSGEVLDGLVCFFSVFADSTRVRILSALAITELCVTDISRVLDINQTTVSHQLRYLKNLGIVTCNRLGKVIFYSLKNEIVNDVLLKGVEFRGYGGSARYMLRGEKGKRKEVALFYCKFGRRIV